MVGIQIPWDWLLMDRAWGMGKTGQGNTWCNVTLDPQPLRRTPCFPPTGWKFKYCVSEAAQRLEVRLLLTQFLPSAVRCEMKGMARIY